jgi:hypothetical protein
MAMVPKPWVAVLEDGGVWLAEKGGAEGYILLRRITRDELQTRHPGLAAELRRLDHMDTPKIVREQRR